MGPVLSDNQIRDRILSIRGNQVMLDSDLAQLYEVETGALKRAVRRNIERFPADFMFELTKDELANLRCQFGISSWVDNLGGHGGDRYAPFVFAEPGVAMLSSVLRSDRAIQINIAIMRAFIQLRKQASNQIDILEKFNYLEQRFNQLEIKFQNQAHSPQSSPRQIIVSVTKADSTPAFAKPSEPGKIYEIKNTVAQYWGLRIKDLESTNRTKAIALPRQIAVYFVRTHLQIGFREIGKHFGGKDHTTILYAYRKIQADIEKNKVIREAILSIQKLLLASAQAD